MLRALAPEEIERVLNAQVVGRIGCHAGGRSYVVPLAYKYQDGSILAHSAPGQKIDMMREDPNVCFEVDHVEDLVNWTSVICWGTYEELSGAEAERALDALSAWLAHELPRYAEHGEPAADDRERIVAFRIRLSEKSGRQERLYWEFLRPARPAQVRSAGTFGRFAEGVPDDVRSEIGAEELSASSNEALTHSGFVPEDVLAECDMEAQARVIVFGDESTMPAPLD